MRIILTYVCQDCGHKFDHLKHDRSEPDPDCPRCAATARKVPAGFAIGGGAVSQAADIAYDIMSRDLGFTDMKDHTRPGDVVAPNLPAHLNDQVQNMWKPSGDIMAAAKAGAQAARAEGSNPLSLVQRTAKSHGSAKVLCNPVNRER